MFWSSASRLADEAALQSQQIADSQFIFKTSAFLSNAVSIGSGGISFRYEYGLHEAAVLDQQISASSNVFQAIVTLPQQPILGITRDFAISQEEQPLDVPCQFKIRTAYLPSVSIQAPVSRPWVQTRPEYPLDQLGSVFFKSPTAPALPPPPPALIIAFLQTSQQEFASLESNGSDVVQPVGQTGSVIVGLFDPVNLTLTETLTATGQWEGVVELSWSKSTGVQEYRLYINGVPQPSTMHALIAQVSGLALDTHYTFAIVASPLGVDASPLSNVIAYRHASSAEFETITEFPWGNTPETAKVTVIPLGTPE